MSNILVTGGAGFIGSHFVKLLLEKKHNVVVIDKLTYAGNLNNLPKEEKFNSNSYTFYPFDIANSMIKDVLNDHKIDVVVNFAAESHVDRSIKDPEAFLKTDIMGLFNLVRYALKANVKKFIHISTDEVYGPIQEKEMIIESEISFILWPGEVKENYPLNPTSPYSASKASADLLLLAYHKTYGLPIVICRPCNNYGPNQYPEKLIPMIITRLLQDKRILLHGEGEEIREWIYVADCCQAIYNLMMHSSIGEIYNIGSSDRKSNLGVIMKIIENMKGGIFDNFLEKISNRPGNDKRYAINSDKLKSLFDKTYLKTNFDDGIKQTIDWYKENTDFWKNVNLDSNIYSGEYLR